MAKNNGKVPGTYVSEKELNELGQLLAGFRDYILSHEARLELIEGWINEYHKTYSEPASEAGGTTEVEVPYHGGATAAEVAALDEPTDDSEER